ncbi:glycosyltransferase family 2 protein [Polynucleobacter necessarius]|uniref:glycosyltransferase family 2 protein n=1 Tax=Polynucleobacter necessarius TaxID=576610 RepID=UPI000E09B2AD|nr:glycosyltransferase family 2 protein [Polynucleobacter necessarius]
MKLSICIPTYNRANLLVNCLNSIISCKRNSDLNFQVCISDNHSTDGTEDVVRAAQLIIDIKYQRNSSNLGIPRNFLNVVSMAEGEFVWLLGDDDMLMPYAIEKLYRLIDGHPAVDYFFVNSFNISTEFIKGFPAPFDIVNLPSNMDPYSKFTFDGERPFLQLIDPKITFDFLGMMSYSVFRRDSWIRNTNVLDAKALLDKRTFSHFDNTFPHIKIFAKAFSKSQAYFNAEPLSVCVSGAREWSDLNPLVMSVRLIDALKEYRNNGLPYWKYVYCKNDALKYFIPDFIKILLYKEKSGYSYVSPVKLLLESFLYPNFYLSFLYDIGRRVRRVFARMVKIIVSRRSQYE